MAALRSLAVAACILMALAAMVTARASAAPSVLLPTPAAWDYGNVDIHGGRPSQTFTFTNNTPGTVTVNTVGIVGPGGSAFQLGSNSCTAAMLSTFGQCNVQVIFTPDTTGLETAALEITDDTGTLDVPLSGTGITGTLSANPDPIQFTPQPYFYGGQQQTVTIQDSNDAGVQASSAVITGPDAAVFSIGWGQNCGGQQYNAGSNCSMGINFNPPNHAGTFQAELQITSDSLSSPLVVPISATALNGPHAVVTPIQTDFGAVAVGGSVARTLTVSNDGDFPMQVQGMLVITGTPADLPVTADGCTGQTVGVGSGCQFTVTYRPSAPRELDATVIVLSNDQGAPAPAGLTGEGVVAVDGSVAVSGHPAAGSTLSCMPIGYPGGTSFSYTWLRDGRPMAGASAAHLTLRDADIGTRIACRIDASNAVSAQVATSPTIGPVTPMSLVDEPGAFTDGSTCRQVVTAGRLRLGRRLILVGGGVPTTPWGPLTLTSTVALWVRIDGRAAGAGTLVVISPQTLAAFPNGRHTLTVDGAGAHVTARLVLGACGLAGRLDGGPLQATTISASSRYGIGGVTFRLPPQLHLAARAGRVVGWATITTAGYPSRGFDLVGPRTESNAVTVTLSAHGIAVSNLPPRTGVIAISLRAGVLSGRGGIIRLWAWQRGLPGLLRASTPATWLR